jgi:amino-acid N-acetyltransferase
MIRKARVGDVKEIQSILRTYARDGNLLARSLSELYTNLRDMFVFEDDTGRIIACCSLHIFWEDLAEVRSLAVREPHRKKGIARKLLEACISEGHDLGIAMLFTLTDRVELFERFGFSLVEKDRFPQKVYNECTNCTKYPDFCDESALVLDLRERFC